MGQNRKNYNSKFKLQVVMELVSGQKTQSQVTSEYWVHPTQQNKWKKQFIENAESIFDDKRKKDNSSKDNEKIIDSVYSKLWKVTMEKEWLEKKMWDFSYVFWKT